MVTRDVSISPVPQRNSDTEQPPAIGRGLSGWLLVLRLAEQLSHQLGAVLTLPAPP
ncbi:Uncharacterised protein [Mycobacteroides abscessus]|nr:Uncharacterised protein [Mycobacteroides abscessus]